MTLHEKSAEFHNTSAWQNLTKLVAFQSDEEVLLLFDGTLLGSGKKGLAVTDRRVIGFDGNKVEEVALEDVIFVEAVPLPGRLDLFDKLVLHCTLGRAVPLELEAGQGEVGRVQAVIRSRVDPERWKAFQKERGLEQLPAAGRIIPVEESELSPICPHCEQELDRLLIRDVAAFLGRRYIYYCPKCRKALAVSHRKGYIAD